MGCHEPVQGRGRRHRVEVGWGVEFPLGAVQRKPVCEMLCFLLSFPKGMDSLRPWGLLAARKGLQLQNIGKICML